MVLINRPRFEDSDFEGRDQPVIVQDSKNSLGISERGRELLRSVNAILDGVSEIPSDEADAPIMLQFPGQAERSGRFSTDERR